MQIANKWTMTLVAVAMGLAVSGCSKEEEQPKPAPSAAKPPPPPPAATPSVPEKPPEPKLNPKCPSGSKGEGSHSDPCLASGSERMMDVVWSGKTDDKGPLFKVTNRTKSAILFGKIVVYFYDKSGKQLEVAGAGGSTEKKPYLTCSGNMFGGVVKPSEKFSLTFSCVKKERVPEGTKAIEAEMETVGFADESEKSVDYYWENKDLSPEQRKKVGK